MQPETLKLINDVMNDVTVTGIEITGDETDGDVLLFYALGWVNIDCADHSTYWMDLAGELHRDNRLPAIIYADGVKEWWIHGSSD